MATFPSSLDGFEPQRLLGRGGFGEVWLANQTNLDRDVAIKVGLSPLASADSKQRFERECKALGRLTNHRNIVDVYMSGFTDDELPFIVMEYIDGGTLKDRIGNIAEQELLTIADQLCDGLQAAHSAGVLHRDLKPENIFLRKNGEAVVGDFGIARLSELGVTTSGAIPATVAYAAPETLSGIGPTPATDVYGIAISIITAKLGKNPYRVDSNDSVPALLLRVISDPIPDLTNHFTNPIAACLTQATIKDPAQRISSAQALRDALRGSIAKSSTNEVDRHVQQTQPVATPPPSQPSTANVHAVQGQARHPQTTQQPLTQQSLTQHTPTQATPNQVIANYTNPGFQPSPTQFGTTKPRPWLLIGTVLAVTTMFIVGAGFIVSGLSKDSTTSAGSSQPTVSTEPTTPESTAPASTAPQLTPLFLPLGLEDIISATGLPREVDALEPITGPANNTVFCNRRAEISGLEETIAEGYTPGGGVQGVASQRVMRFQDPAAASAHLASYLETSSCGEWTEVVSDGGPSTLRSEQSNPQVLHGDEIFQIDTETNLPTGITTYARNVIVRRGPDVIRISFASLDEERTHASADALTARAIEALDA